MNKYFDMHFNKEIVTIYPGEFFSSGGPEMISTVLGSCVSIALFDAIAGVGGMNHFMLAKDTSVEGSAANMNVAGGLGRFGEYAMDMLIQDMEKKGAQLERCKAKVFGGGNIFGVPESSKAQVGRTNVEFAFKWLQDHKIEVLSSDTGGSLPRKVFLDPVNFRVFLKHINNAQIEGTEFVKSSERSYIEKLAEMNERAKAEKGLS